MRTTWIIALAFAAMQMFAQIAPQAADQTKPKGILPEDETRKLVPESFFFHGQAAPTQKRNSAAVRTGDERIWMAALVDTAGYASAVAERFQGFLMTETELTINGKLLAPGVYAIGSDPKDNFIVQDLGRKEVLVVPIQRDSEMLRPRPLQITPSGSAWRLYLGRKFVQVESR